MPPTVRRYAESDAPALLALLRSEGAAWGDYHNDGMQKYAAALRTSIVYVLYEDGILCGYARLRDDDGFGVYVYDLLVHRDCRGKGYGALLLEKARKDYPDCGFYIMSDVDRYYEKLGVERVGSIFSM